MCFIEVDDLALNGQVMPVIQTKISFNIIGNKQLTINYLYLWWVIIYIDRTTYLLLLLYFRIIKIQFLVCKANNILCSRMMTDVQFSHVKKNFCG